MAQPFSLTVDGIESQFGVNHLGCVSFALYLRAIADTLFQRHFLWSNLLLPKLKTSSNPTIVNVSSSGHRFLLGNYDNYNWENVPYNIWNAYGQGKGANVLFTTALTKRGIRSVALHPGCE